MIISCFSAGPAAQLDVITGEMKQQQAKLSAMFDILVSMADQQSCSSQDRLSDDATSLRLQGSSVNGQPSVTAQTRFASVNPSSSLTGNRKRWTFFAPSARRESPADDQSSLAAKNGTSAAAPGKPLAGKQAQKRWQFHFAPAKIPPLWCQTLPVPTGFGAFHLGYLG